MPSDDRTRRVAVTRSAPRRAGRSRTLWRLCVLSVTAFGFAGFTPLTAFPSLSSMPSMSSMPSSVAAQANPSPSRTAAADSKGAEPADTPTKSAGPRKGRSNELSSDELPSGYVTQVDGAVRWTYPLAADDEVRALRGTQAQTWHRITDELGAAVDPALDIRVARNPEEMRALVGATTPLPGYADGIAFPESGLVLLTLTDPDTFLRPNLQTVLAHELSHVALHRAIGAAGVPRWFSEGVAVQQSEESSFGRFRTLWEGTIRGNLLAFDRLANGFPSRRDEVDLAYAQSADFVGYLLAGKDELRRFRRLLSGLREGTAFPEAVETAYHVPLSYMEREWRANLQQRFGRWPMVFMGATSLWVLIALLLVVAYARARARHRATLERWEAEERAVLATAALALPAAGVIDAPSSTPAGAVQSSLDDFFENRHTKHEPGVPTIVHDGQSHTLH